MAGAEERWAALSALFCVNVLARSEERGAAGQPRGEAADGCRQWEWFVMVDGAVGRGIPVRTLACLGISGSVWKKGRKLGIFEGQTENVTTEGDELQKKGGQGR
jgi:hypothetical protein